MPVATEAPASIPSFEEWVSHCFDHPGAQPSQLAWYFDIDAPYCSLPAAIAVKYLTRLFLSPHPIVGHLDDGQLSQGFNYIASNSASDYSLCLADPSVAESDRIACVRSMEHLYTDLFAPRCTDVHSSGQSHRSHASPLNATCYMWWDTLPINGAPADSKRAALDREILGLLGRLLAIPSIACQESALHGLGHWAIYYPTQCREIIERFLARVREPFVLGDYARCAAKGMVQ